MCFEDDDVFEELGALHTPDKCLTILFKALPSIRRLKSSIYIFGCFQRQQIN
jgi:hypothetical protein